MARQLKLTLAQKTVLTTALAKDGEINKLSTILARSLVSKGLIEETGQAGYSYRLTAKGFEVARQADERRQRRLNMRDGS